MIWPKWIQYVLILEIALWYIVFVFDVLLNNYGHMEMEPLFKDASERLEKPGIKLVTPCLQGKNPNHLATGLFNKNLKC